MTCRQSLGVSLRLASTQSSPAVIVSGTGVVLREGSKAPQGATASAALFHLSLHEWRWSLSPDALAKKLSRVSAGSLGPALPEHASCLSEQQSPVFAELLLSRSFSVRDMSLQHSGGS